MSSVGGSIVAVTFDGRRFSVPADADVQRKLGGFMNAVESNGDETARLIKTREPWSLDGVTVAVDDSRGDAEFLQALADQNDFFAITAELASGVIYQGTGQIVGDLQTGTQASSAAFNLMGTGKLTPQ